MREGEAALGVWLPLALGSLMTLALNALKAEGAPEVKMSDVLASWALPTLAEGLRREEAREAEDRMIANFNALAERFGGKKVEIYWRSLHSSTSRSRESIRLPTSSIVSARPRRASPSASVRSQPPPVRQPMPSRPRGTR